MRGPQEHGTEGQIRSSAPWSPLLLSGLCEVSIFASPHCAVCRVEGGPMLALPAPAFSSLCSKGRTNAEAVELHL